MVMRRRRAMCRVRFVRALLNVGVFVRERCADASEVPRRRCRNTRDRSNVCFALYGCGGLKHAVFECLGGDISMERGV
jgi:hypothetical protein